MNILFNNIKKEMEKKEVEKKPIEIIKTNLDKINNDIECIRKDIQEIFVLIKAKEEAKKTLEKESMWFFT